MTTMGCDSDYEQYDYVYNYDDRYYTTSHRYNGDDDNDEDNTVTS